MRLIMAGGGTGGHIYPAITIAKAVKDLVNPTEVLFVGTANGMEADIVPKEGFELATIDIRGFERRISLGNIKTAIMTVGSIFQSIKIIKRFNPDVVVGTGGYVCGPVLLAAHMLKIKTMIQEQNAVPGITNKILARFVDKIAVGYQDSLKYFPAQEKIVVTGNPIRPEILAVSRQEGLECLGLNSSRLTILAVGGSRGAHRINTAMIDLSSRICRCKDIQILHVTGQNEYNNIVGIYKQQGIDISRNGNIMIKPYLYNMPDALAVADIGIFRAGALGLAELTAKGIPAVLIPYPYAAENHQEHNARVLERHGAAVVIRDQDLDGPKLVSVVEMLLADRTKLSQMAGASKSLGRPRAASEIAELAINLSSHN